MRRWNPVKSQKLATILVASFWLSGCGGGGGVSQSQDDSGDEIVISVFGACGSEAVIQLPCDFPQPREEPTNPVTAEKITLGRFLFYDRNMSFNQTQSCGDCHQQALGFTDGQTVSTGSEGGVHPRNAMSMTNVVYNATLNWANHRIVTLEQQALAVINNDAPIELGWITNDRIDQILGRLRSPQVADYQFAANQFATLPPDYPALFAAAFPEDDEPVSLANFIRAIAAFGSIFISGDSEFDKAQRGEPNTMPESAQRGQDLFFSEELECFHCHNGFNFTDSFDHATNAFTHNTFHNNGLYNIDVTGDGEGDGRYPDDNRGLWEVTRNTFDEGKFRAPTLRNIELTAPYMHDGSIATLDDVIAHYARGGRLITSGANAGDGSLNPFKSSFVKGFVLNSDEVADLKAFLVSLTDWDFLCRESLADPFGVIQKHNQCPVAP